MSYLVLARKFRPQTFSALVGQEHISQALANAIIRGRVPHALLFTGPRGVGKTSSARVFARALNCTGRQLDEAEVASTDTWEQVEPCGECANCREIAKSSSLAVWEIDGASNNSVDNVRDLIDSLRSLPPPGSQYKIYIIDEVHMLSVAAFNALLKSLEEPPPNTIFIFATTEPHKIPETVISRCQRHDFRRIAELDIASHLKAISETEKVVVEEGVFTFIARRAQGGMRDAQSMFDRLISFGDSDVSLAAAQRVFGVLDHSFFAKLSVEIFASNAPACFSLIEQAFSQSLDVRTFLGDFLEHWRNLLLLSYKQNTTDDAAKIFEDIVRLSSKEREELQNQVEGRSSFELQRLFDIAEETVTRAQQGMYPRYSVEAGLAKMLTLPTLRAVPELLDELRGLAGSSTAISRVAALSAVNANEVKASAVTSNTVTLGAVTSGTVTSGIGTSNPDTGDSATTTTTKLIADPAETSTPNLATEPVVAEVVVVGQDSFNPSWQSFVAHVRSRRMPVLEALLKRISPAQFTNGVLVADASEFDRTTIMGGDTQKFLRDCLHSYSGTQDWSISFNEPSSASSANGPLLAGSVAADEARKRKQSRLKIDREARNDPAVQSVLDVFSGSSIERIDPLNK